MTFQFRTDLTEKTPVPDLLRYIEQLEQRVATADDVNAAQAPANLQRQFGLTKSEAQILINLSDGRVHSKENLLDMLYSHRPDELPETKIIDVWVCKIRRKVEGTAIDIRTQWGIGYFVADVAPVKAAIAGETLPRGVLLPGQPARVPGDKPLRRYGQVLDMAKDALRAWADDAGVVTIRSSALARACSFRAAGSDLIRRLERHGFLSVSVRPEKGGVWSLRLL